LRITFVQMFSSLAELLLTEVMRLQAKDEYLQDDKD
jgi:hypothetical protein